MDRFESSLRKPEAEFVAVNKGEFMHIRVKECIYCGGKPLTREHVVAHWVHRYVKSFGVGSTTFDGNRNVQYANHEPKPKIACAKCNGEQGSMLDATAKELLEPLIDLKYFNEQIVVFSFQGKQLLFRAWLLKMMINHYFDAQQSRDIVFFNRIESLKELGPSLNNLGLYMVRLREDVVHRPHALQTVVVRTPSFDVGSFSTEPIVGSDQIRCGYFRLFNYLFVLCAEEVDSTKLGFARLRLRWGLMEVAYDMNEIVLPVSGRSAWDFIEYSKSYRPSQLEQLRFERSRRLSWISSSAGPGLPRAL